jgi:hypothetical protein
MGICCAGSNRLRRLRPFGETGPPDEGRSPARIRTKFDGARLRRVLARTETCAGAVVVVLADTPAKRLALERVRPIDRRQQTGGATARRCEGRAERNGKHRRRRHRDRPVRTMTSPSTRTASRRNGSRGTYARSVTVPSFGRACTATPCVLRRRIRASVTRRGSAARPRDGFPWPSAKSGLEVVNRCMVVPAGPASDGASIHGTLRDANGRPWPAGPAPALPSTEATTVASTARADGQTGGSVDPNERVRAAGGVEQDSLAGRLYEWTRPTERSDRPQDVTHRL